MNKINLDELKALTEQNQIRLKKEAEDRAIAAAAREERIRLEQENADREKAQKIIDQIPEMAKYAASSGKNSVFVYELVKDDGPCYSGKNEIQRVGKIIFDYCQANQLNPAIGVHHSETSNTYEEGYGYWTTHYYGIQISW